MKIASFLAMTSGFIAQGRFVRRQRKNSCHCEEERRGNLHLFFLNVIGLIFVLCTSNLHADNIRPAYLEINETAPGNLTILWKIPYGLDGKPLDLKPAFPDSYTTTSMANRLKAPDGIVRKWTMVIENNSLLGSRIGIEGLEQNTTDAMVRVRLADGTSFRGVLKPTEPAVTIEIEKESTPVAHSSFETVLRLFDRWRYAILIPLAWWISLRLRARKRSIIFCAMVLLGGGICGHAVGQSDWLQEQLPKYPQETEIKRVLQGLMLNTYRSFMLDDDELIYDCLARSVDGDFLGEVFLQNREILSIKDEESALTLITGLDIKSIEDISHAEDGSLNLHAQWDAYGKVHHWQHIHFRCNTYEAEVTLIPKDGYWKLTKVQVLNEERVL